VRTAGGPPAGGGAAPRGAPLGRSFGIGIGTVGETGRAGCGGALGVPALQGSRVDTEVIGDVASRQTTPIPQHAEARYEPQACARLPRANFDRSTSRPAPIRPTPRIELASTVEPVTGRLPPPPVDGVAVAPLGRVTGVTLPVPLDGRVNGVVLCGDGVGEDGVSEDGVSEDGVCEDGVGEDGVGEDGVGEDGVSEDGAQLAPTDEIDTQGAASARDGAASASGAKSRIVPPARQATAICCFVIVIPLNANAC